MKIVFKIAGGQPRRSCGLRPAATLGLILALMALWPGSAHAQAAYFSTRELLTDFFRTSDSVTFKKIPIGPVERQHLVDRLGYAPARTAYTFYIGTTKGHVDGYALVDEENGEHLPITFAVKLSPAGVVERQEIVVYRESRGDEVRDQRFRKQFVGKTARDPIVANRDIIAISGATISSRAMAVGVKRAVVLFDELVSSKANLFTAQAPDKRPGSL